MRPRRPRGIVLIAALVAACTVASLAFLFGNVIGSTAADRPFSIGGWLLVFILGLGAFRQLIRRGPNAAASVAYWGGASLVVALGLPLIAAPTVSLGALLLSTGLAIAMFFAVVWPLVRYVRKETVAAA